MGRRWRPGRPWREVSHFALGREAGRIYSEHVMYIWRLYEVERLSMTDIAAVYGTTVESIYRIIIRVRNNAEGKGTAADERYCAKAERHGEVLRLLTMKRSRGYEVIARETGVEVKKVRAIARRNKLER